MEKILLISLKLNSTPNTLGCYGLTESDNRRSNAAYFALPVTGAVSCIRLGDIRGE